VEVALAGLNVAQVVALAVLNQRQRIIRHAVSPAKRRMD
jgi:hypothetical protein